MPAPSRNAFELARNYRRMATKVDDYIAHRFDTLASDELFELLELSDNLFRVAGTAALVGARLDLAEMAEAAAQVNAATGRLEAAIDTLDDARKVITAVTASINLAGAIASGKPDAILGAVKDLRGPIAALD
jgi:hypothetical protein